MTILVTALFKQKFFLGKSLILSFFEIQGLFSFPCTSLANEVQISYLGTLLETRHQELSFGIKIYRILFIIFDDISP